jgi:8-oxo-dGTP diphosphatase
MTTTTEPQHIGACAVLINLQGQILLGKRKNGYKPGVFGLPGGRVELNEPLLTAVAREVFEETGLQNLSFTFVGVIRENQANYDFIHFVFSAEIGDQQPMLTEPEKCEGWQWFDTNNFPETLACHAMGIELYLKNETLTDLTQ